jgi:hypothetical protein
VQRGQQGRARRGSLGRSQDPTPESEPAPMPDPSIERDSLISTDARLTGPDSGPENVDPGGISTAATSAEATRIANIIYLYSNDAIVFLLDDKHNATYMQGKSAFT